MSFQASISPGRARSARATVVAFALCAVGGYAADCFSAGTPFAWCPPIQVARGPAEQGPWRQNESKYDYVDDATVALHATGSAAVAWVDQARKDVLFQVFERDGRPRFAQAVNVSRTPQVFSWLPRIALGAGRPHEVYILWQEIVFSGGSHGGDMFFARSRDGGASFETPVNLSQSSGGDGKGRINREFWHNGSFDLAMAPDGALYAAWTEYEGALWFTRSLDGGTRFSTPTQIVSGTPHPARAPALAVGAGSRVYLAWTVGQDAAADIRLARSADRGGIFGTPTTVSRTSGYSDAPKLAVDSKGTVHLVHAESAGGPFGKYHIRYTRSHDHGRTFERARDLSSRFRPAVASAAFPGLSVDSADRLFVLWELYSDPRHRPVGLALAFSDDGGHSFSSPERVPHSTGPHGAVNGSLQGLLMRKLAVAGEGTIAVVNSAFKANAVSHVSLIRGFLLAGNSHC